LVSGIVHKKLIFLLLIISLFSCKNTQHEDTAFAEFDKYIVYFNYSTGEICLFDIESGNIDKKYQLNIDGIQRYVINKHGFSYKWYYNNDDTNAYLREVYSEGNIENRYTRIYKIDMEHFGISEIYYSDKYLNNICIIDDDLYLMSYVEPSYGIMNKEKNYIVLYNFTDKTEKIINFNESLAENDKICAPYFRVSGNKIIMIGWIDKIFQLKLYEYDMETKTVNIIADEVNGFSFFINNDTVIYNTGQNKKWLVVYNLIGNTYKILLKSKEIYRDYFVVDENIIIYALENETMKSFLNKFWIFPGSKIDENYYIAEIKGKNRNLLFNNKNVIEILGVMNKNQIK
jgi:hypothetical protein